MAGVPFYDVPATHVRSVYPISAVAPTWQVCPSALFQQDASTLALRPHLRTLDMDKCSLTQL